jgi:molybdenum cofactor biosynthesis protein A
MKMLEDKFGRQITYLRLSVTDRCNLRCSYCMPETGMIFAPKKEVLSYEEMLTLAEILGDLGIRKIRVTGGEPFVRKDLIYFLKNLSAIPTIDQVSITSNLTLIRPHLQELLDSNITSVNVSLDAMDKKKFHEITRRDVFEEVEQTLFEMIKKGFYLKINCVAMAGKNEDQIVPLMELARKHPISVRFLEEMPFNGSGEEVAKVISYKDILDIIGQSYTYTKLLDEPSSTSMNYQIEGFEGSFGIIPSFSRTFCGDCNRLRLSATGEVRTCLYGGDELNLRDLLRSGASKQTIQNELIAAVDRKPKDGFAAADKNESTYLSMTKLGG